MENQRIRITKKMLKDSLLTLLKEKDILKISVREICDVAAINRTTFYKYYGSQFDLLTEMENDMFLEIDRNLGNVAVLFDQERRLVNILSFLEDNIEFCRILLNTNIDSDFAERLFQFPAIKIQLDAYISTGGYTPQQYDYIYNFIIYGCFSIVKSWINKDLRESPEEISNLLYRIILKE